MREQARYKVYRHNYLATALDPNYPHLHIPASHKGNRFQTLSSFTGWYYTDRLSKVNYAKLKHLMGPDIPLEEYIEGVGFKSFHRKTGEPIYVIAGEFREDTRDAERQTILLRRYNPEKFNTWVKNAWDPRTQSYYDLPIEKQVQNFMRNNSSSVKPVYLDRLKQKELDKLSMLYLLDHNSYIPGIGGMFLRQEWDHIERKHKPGSPIYFLEV